jgi:iron complex transport system permease protein
VTAVPDTLDPRAPADDTIARVLVPRQELPVGVVTAFVGAPVLLWLIRNKQVNTQ